MKKLIIFGNGEFASIAKYYFSERKIESFCIDDKFLKEKNFEGIPLIGQSELLKIEKNEFDNVDPKELVGTESETNVNEFTGWTGESKSRLIDKSRESELLEELDQNVDGPQRHGLNAFENPNENWFLQT